MIKDHKLSKALKQLDWNSLNQGNLFINGFRPLQPLRRVFALLILEHVRGLQGEELLQQWLEVPMMQHFKGEDLNYWELPITNQELIMSKNQLSKDGENLL